MFVWVVVPNSLFIVFLFFSKCPLILFYVPLLDIFYTYDYLINLQFVYCSVDKNIYTNCKPHLFLTNGKKVVKLTPKQIENVRDIGFEGLLKMKPLVYIIVLTRTYTQVLVYILTLFIVCSSILFKY